MNVDRHHLIPKKFKGTEQFLIHKICHRKIHSAFTEKQLLRTYSSWDALKGSAEIRDFIAWVAKKEPGYYSRTFSAKRKKR